MCDGVGARCFAADLCARAGRWVGRAPALVIRASVASALRAVVLSPERLKIAGTLTAVVLSVCAVLACAPGFTIAQSTAIASTPMTVAAARRTPLPPSRGILEACGREIFGARSRGIVGACSRRHG